MNWKPVQAAFPVNSRMIWLNNCGITPAGSHVVAAMRRYLEDYALQGIFTPTAVYPAVRRRIKTILGRLLNCPAESLCLIHNTSEGMNVVSRGLALRPGQEILLLENEYPSNVYPWRHWADQGVRLVTVPAETSPERFLSAFRERISDATRVAAMSAVHWCTGMPLPLVEMGKICRENDVFFAVDGAQGVGMQPIDVEAMGIDFMAFSAWKWLMGPLGLGGLYVAPHRLDSLTPVFVGTESVVKDEEYLPYKSELKPDADRFAFSTPSLNDWVYFLAALEFLDAIGFETVRKRIFELTDYLNQRLRRMGFRVYSDHFPDHPTGITVCDKPGVPSGRLMDRLKENGVIAAERLGRIRFSPHIYLSKHQLDAAARTLSQACISQMYSQTITRQ